MPKSIPNKHLNELIVVQVPILVDVGALDHFLKLLLCQLLTKVSHYVAELISSDYAVPFYVYDLKCLE